jgi:hypothetical protein
MVAWRQFGEPVMTLAEAAGWLERRFGRRPNVASIWRWATKGVKGVRLATISLGRFRYTTETALQQFLAGTSRGDAGRDDGATYGAGMAQTTATSKFTRAEVVAATKRRELEKAKSIEFLRSRLGAVGRKQEPSSPKNKTAEN